jgi:competence protein ComEC
VKNLNFYIVAFGFVSAICISSFLNLGITFLLFLILLSVFIFVFGKFFASHEDRQKILLIVLFLISFVIGALRYEIKDYLPKDKNLENNLGNKAQLIGIVSDEPTQKENQTQIIVELKNIIISRTTIPVYGKAMVSTDPNQNLKYGDRVQIEGKLKTPSNFVSTSTNEFNYVGYLLKDEIQYTIDFAKVDIQSRGNGNFLKSILFDIKNSFTQNLNKNINEPESSLMSGILLGGKNALDKETSNTFRIAGLSHVVALSGYNITIVADSIMKILYFLPRLAGLFSGIFGIIIFVILSGGSSTAIRAAIMSIIVILSKITHRKYNIGRALMVAGLLMLFVNPKILVYDISFQLSFLATVAIIYLSPITYEKLKFVTEKFKLRETLASTLSAQLFVLPLIIYKMGLISFVGLPTNILILPIIPITMLFGFLTGIIGFFSGILSLPFGLISYLLTHYIIFVAKFFAGLPFSSVTVINFPLIFMVILYVLIGFFIYKNREIGERATENTAAR